MDVEPQPLGEHIVRDEQAIRDRNDRRRVDIEAELGRVWLQYRNPESQITVRLKEEGEPRVDLGPTDMDPEVVMSMEADTAHKFWLGKVHVTVALARGQMKAKGPVAKILKLVPLVKPVFPKYKQQLAAAGREDLVDVA